MGQQIHAEPHPADLPPVTDDHRQRAHKLLAMRCNYTTAMADPFMGRLINACAANLRTDDWLRTQRRTVVRVARCRAGLDGHPIGWCSQLVPGPWAARQQLEL